MGERSHETTSIHRFSVQRRAGWLSRGRSPREVALIMDTGTALKSARIDLSAEPENEAFLYHKYKVNDALMHNVLETLETFYVLIG